MSRNVGTAQVRTSIGPAPEESSVTPKPVSSTAIALIVAALLTLVSGIYTDNGGFQLAGAMVFLVAVVLAIKELGDGRREREKR